MKKEVKIEIDLNNKYDLVDKYNENKISEEFFEYIIKQVENIKKNNNIKIVINKKCSLENDIKKLLNEGLNVKYNRSLQLYFKNNFKQIILLIIGILFIFFSTKVKDDFIWQEVFLISGWVPIWEVIEVELFSDVEIRKRRRNIKKILDSEIVVK